MGQDSRGKIKRSGEVEFKRLLVHVNKTYGAKFGIKGYPVLGEDIKHMKFLVKFFGLYPSMALWDIFLTRDLNWIDKNGMTVKVPHTLRVFRNNINILLEEGQKWREKAEAMEREDFGAPPESLARMVNGITKSIGGPK